MLFTRSKIQRTSLTRRGRSSGHYLVPNGHISRELAKEVHTELASKMLYAIDARKGLRLPSDYILRDRDIISIVTAARKKD